MFNRHFGNGGATDADQTSVWWDTMVTVRLVLA